MVRTNADYKYTSVAVDQVAAADGNYQVLFLGTGTPSHCNSCHLLVELIKRIFICLFFFIYSKNTENNSAYDISLMASMSIYFWNISPTHWQVTHLLTSFL